MKISRTVIARSEQARLEATKQSPMKMTNRFSVLAFSIAIVPFISISACGKPVPPPAPPPVAVILMSVRAVDLVIAYKSSATLEAWDKADLAAEITGRVREIYADEGANVRAGSVLARLDASVLSASASEAGARLADAEVAAGDAIEDRNRIARLRTEGIASQEEYDKADVRVRRMKQTVAASHGTADAARGQLSKTTISSPITGTVTRRLIKIGETASPGKVLFRVENLSAIKVVLDIPEQEIGSMQSGDSVVVTVTGGDSIAGVITYVSPSADPLARTIKVEARIANSDRRLRSGIFAEVAVIRSTLGGVIAVPKSALVYRADGAASLYVIENGVVHKRDVTLGNKTETMVEILKGLRMGESIVPADVATLSDGVKITITGAPPTTTTSN